MEEEKYIEALIQLHVGLKRQGPGDADFSDDILNQFTELPPNPRIADLGCGAGAGTLMLAKKYRTKVKAVDFSKDFLDQMMQQAREEGLADFIEPIECDMGNLNWELESIDLLWSEGAAYTITFEGALKAWRPLMAKNGIAVISEMSYFSENSSENVTQMMQNIYPGIKTESENIELIQNSGFEVLETRRLPSKAWWGNYYDPLHENIAALKNSGDEMMQLVIKDTENEMELFKKHHENYGYTFYMMRAA